MNTHSQTLKIRFEIKKTRLNRPCLIGKANPEITYDTSVLVLFTINGHLYGRLSTGIVTFRSIWDGRKKQPMPAESKALTNTLLKFEMKAEVAFENLVKQGIAIDARILLDSINGEGVYGVTSLVQLYTDFMAIRKQLIVSDHKQRSPEQISPETYETYSKRWVLIYAYLKHANQVNIPVHAIPYSFATNLKEWLISKPKPRGGKYSTASINKVISLLKLLMNYAVSKGYVNANKVASFPCRGSSPTNPKPLTQKQLDLLENSDRLSSKLRHICDSWLIAGELCLHYSDYKKLPKMKFITSHGMRFIQHERSKQSGNRLVQTVNVTERAERLLEKWGGPSKLYYKTSGAFSNALKQIAYLVDLVDEEGNYVDLQFGMGRDSGLTQRAIDGANGIQLSKMAGWSKPVYAERYIGNPLEIVEAFAKGLKQPTKSGPNTPFSYIHKAS